MTKINIRSIAHKQDSMTRLTYKVPISYLVGFSAVAKITRFSCATWALTRNATALTMVTLTDCYANLCKEAPVHFCPRNCPPCLHP